MVWLPSPTDKLQPRITQHQGCLPKGDGGPRASVAGSTTTPGKEESRALRPMLHPRTWEKYYDTAWREGPYFRPYSYGVQGGVLRNVKSRIEEHPGYPRVEWHGRQGGHAEGRPQTGVLPVARSVCSVHERLHRERSHRRSATPPSSVCAKGPS